MVLGDAFKIDRGRGGFNGCGSFILNVFLTITVIITATQLVYIFSKAYDVFLVVDLVFLH